MVWDPTQPATNAPLLSAPIRDNFAALDALMTGGGGVTFPLLAPDGSAAAPSYSFTAQAGTGWYRGSSNGITLGGAGIDLIHFGYNVDLVGITIRSDHAIGWSNLGAAGVATDLRLSRDGAGILAQKNASALQKLRVYGDATNYVEVSGVAGLTAPVVIGTGVTRIQALTQAAYDALTPKVATTLYVITP